MTAMFLDGKHGAVKSPHLCALHESAYGTKQTYRDDLLFVRFRGEADMPRPPPAYHSVAFDPKRTSVRHQDLDVIQG
jgi:hypothetical protein